jgi:hypothetical protein
VPDRLRLLLAAATAVLLLAGCGGEEPAAPSSPAPAGSTAAPSSAAPTSATPTPSRPSPSSAPPSSASPSSASPSSAAPSATGSATPASVADGVYANGLSVSEDGALSYVPLRWYAGKNAEVRCAEKEIAAEGAWCVEYYYEEAGGRKASALTEQTQVRLLDDDLEPAEGSLTDLVTAIEDEVWPNFQIAISGGKVTRITQVFTP